MFFRERFGVFVVAFACVGLSTGPVAAQAGASAGSPSAPASPEKPKAPEPLPPPPVRVWVIAPGPTEAWTLRLDNEGTRPVRVPADARLLELEIDVPVLDPEEPKGAAAPAKKKPAAKKKPPKPVKCAAPDTMRPSSFPEDRELLLAPGESYMQTFDPRLLCFGKNAGALVGGAVARIRFGWAPPKVSPWAKKKPAKAPTGPFAAESTDDPAVFAAASRLDAPTIVLSYFKSEPAKEAEPREPIENSTGEEGNLTSEIAAKPPAIVDANAPRLVVTALPFADASSANRVSVTTTAKNVGRRPMLAALRSRMIGYHVAGPDGEFTCPASPPTHAIPRDMYRSYKPDEATSFTALLSELCPQGSFSRPGLYHVTPTLFALESGSELGIKAYTSVVRAEAATLVRVQTGADPFYSSEPKATPTPKPALPEGDATQE